MSPNGTSEIENEAEERDQGDEITTPKQQLEHMEKKSYKSRASEEFRGTCNKIWTFHSTPESKQQLSNWRHSFKHAHSACVFWTTINAEKYCETLKKLRRTIQN